MRINSVELDRDIGPAVRCDPATRSSVARMPIVTQGHQRKLRTCKPGHAVPEPKNLPNSNSSGAVSRPRNRAISPPHLSADSFSRESYWRLKSRKYRHKIAETGFLLGDRGTWWRTQSVPAGLWARIRCYVGKSRILVAESGFFRLLRSPKIFILQSFFVQFPSSANS